MRIPPALLLPLALAGCASGPPPEALIYELSRCDVDMGVLSLDFLSSLHERKVIFFSREMVMVRPQLGIVRVIDSARRLTPTFSGVEKISFQDLGNSRGTLVIRDRADRTAADGYKAGVIDRACWERVREFVGVPDLFEEVPAPPPTQVR